MLCAFFPKFFQHGGDELLRAIDLLKDDLDIHSWLAELACALAIDAVLADKSHGVGKHVHRDGEASARDSHLEFVKLKFLALFVEDRS